MRVQEIMSSNVYTVTPHHTVDRAALLMWEHDVGVVPVVEGDGRLCGVITDRDIAMAALLRGVPLDRIRVADAMAVEIVTVGPEDDVALAEQRMASRQVRRLPVVDAVNRVVGLISINDLVHAAAYREGPGVPAIEVARTLQKVCQWRHPTDA